LPSCSQRSYPLEISLPATRVVDTDLISKVSFIKRSAMK
jgi:hypothetical protein